MAMLAKLIELAAVVILAWKAVQFGAAVQRRQTARAGEVARDRAGAAGPGAGQAQDLRRCAACGAYVAPTSSPCGRGDCPQRP